MSLKDLFKRTPKGGETAEPKEAKAMPSMAYAVDQGTAADAFAYRTVNNASPQGRSRVFFCCHPEDFEPYFEPLAQELLDSQPGAAVWYLKHPAAKLSPRERDELLSYLGEMQLFVIPVTGRFLLQSSLAKDVLLPFAMERNVPVLPLMQETGLETEYAQVFGNLQYLDKNVVDPTAIPYAEKLDRFLESVLIGDELAEKIRRAFEAYIFLSYRKKDRKYAQEIMRLIHENDFCRDVAIWYDEFLTPGEDFSKSIEEAFHKSSLFAMVVTPSLLEDPNYVKDVEYPLARKENKTVLPVKAVDTDDSVLKACYDGISELYDEETLGAVLRDKISAVLNSERADDPEHLFFMGLAYLSGIDMEVNSERALKLITRSADGKLPEAYQKLVSMYETGTGVKRDYEKAAEWQKRYVEELLQPAYEADPSFETVMPYSEGSRRLGEMFSRVRNYQAAEEAYRLASLAGIEFYKTIEEDENDTIEQAICKEITRSNLGYGDACRDCGKLEKAGKCYSLAAQLMASETVDSQSIQIRTAALLRCSEVAEIGFLRRENMSCLDTAMFFNNQAFECYSKLRGKEDLDDPKDYYCLLDDLAKRTGSISMQVGNTDGAVQMWERSLQCCERMEDEDCLDDPQRMIKSLFGCGDVYFAIGSFEKAGKAYARAYELAEVEVDKKGTISAKRSLAEARERLSQSAEQAGDMESAYEYLRLAFNVMSELIQPSVLNSKEELGDLFQREGELFLKLDMPDHALSAMSHAVELRMNARNNSNNLNTRAKLCESYDACARAAAGIGNQELAESCFTKALELAEALEDDEPEERFEKLYLKVHRHAAETEINCEDVTEAETTAETVRRLLAQAKLAQEGNAMEEAAKYYLQARDLALDDATTEPSTEKSRLMARVLEARGCFLALTSDPEAAEELQNNVDLCMAIFNSTGLADDYSELGAAYIAQAFLPEKREALYEAKEIFETLVQKFPDETAYRVRYDMVRDVLK